jgi:zeaxanthin glucosyltransferase
MAKIGIICIPSTSHVTTLAALGRELQSRGHHVTVFGTQEFAHKVKQQGLEFWRIGDLDVTESLSQKNKPFARIHSICREAPSALRKAGIELLLVDQMEAAGGSIADYLGIPFITVCSALTINQEVGVPPACIPWIWRYQTTKFAYLRNRIGYELSHRLVIGPTNAVINQYRQQWGLPLIRHADESFSQLAQICQQTADFDFPRQLLPKCFHYTGPLRSDTPEAGDFPYEKLTGQPLIYASMGTRNLEMREQVFAAIAAACEPLNAQLVLTYGNDMPAGAGKDLAGSPLVVGYAPQLELLKRARVTITHAGLNTVLESLSQAVPMVAVPVYGDAFGNAARIAWTGVGEVMSLNKLSVQRLRQAIAKVLTERSYPANAAKQQAAIEQAGGVTRAASIVEQVLTTGKPVLAAG